jgi:adenylate kinase
MLNLVLFGPPGAGKGTQSQKLIDQYQLIHLSTGDLLRSQIADKTELGLKAQEYMNKGELVPDAVVIGMIADKIKSNAQAVGFIFDGFPRTVAQAQALDVMLTANKTAISGMVALVVDEAELTQRILLRGQTSGRADDQDESLVKKRVSEYNTKTKPVADFYAAQQKFTAIEGVGEIETIFANLCLVIDKLPR